jgi:hypothetical protein
MKWLPAAPFPWAPTGDVTGAGFWTDEYAVTDTGLLAFVAAAGYPTVAERPLDLAAHVGGARSPPAAWS